MNELETKPTRILLVDDDQGLVRILRLLLVSQGFEVTTAQDGVTALEKLTVQPFDLIILDLQMPRMDGRAFHQELRNRNIFTPVLIVSAYGAEAARAELDSVAALAKPFDPEVLARTVRDLV